MSTYELETAKGGEAVTPDTPFTECRALWIGGAGDVEVRFASGGTAVYAGVSGVLPVNAVEVLSNGTTATDITTMI